MFVRAQEVFKQLRIFGMPNFVYDYEMDQRKRVRLIDEEMSKQARIVDDLRWGNLHFYYDDRTAI